MAKTCIQWSKIDPVWDGSLASNLFHTDSAMFPIDSQIIDIAKIHSNIFSFIQPQILAYTMLFINYFIIRSAFFFLLKISHVST